MKNGRWKLHLSTAPLNGCISSSAWRSRVGAGPCARIPKRAPPSSLHRVRLGPHGDGSACITCLAHHIATSLISSKKRGFDVILYTVNVGGILNSGDDCSTAALLGTRDWLRLYLQISGRCATVYVNQVSCCCGKEREREREKERNLFAVIKHNNTIQKNYGWLPVRHLPVRRWPPLLTRYYRYNERKKINNPITD